MQRSSPSIASLAAALAKAQAVLVNPEKSLVGSIPPDRPGGTERSFRYASLASGLDIVRKTLGEHEIATVQTTALDQGSSIVNLTTVLAHSSGEWIASEWPVCTIAETATPHRMGAALTYARRYALFTLVGIAGEDDLDAPDLMAAPTSQDGPPKPKPQDNHSLNGGQCRPVRPPPRREKRNSSKPERSTLGLKASAELRARLVSQIAEIGSEDDAALWAYCNLRAKNGLCVADARWVEEAFEGKLAALGCLVERVSLDGQDAGGDTGVVVQTAAKSDDDASTLPPANVPALQRPRPSETALAANRRRARRVKPTGEIDKAVLAFPEPRRIRDRDHVRFVATQPCLICGRRPSDAHHLRFAQSRALGRKVSDEFTVPLCRGHHREAHRCGNEAQWWRKAAVDPTAAARSLWLESYPHPVLENRALRNPTA